MRAKAITLATALALGLVGFMWYRSYVTPVSVARWVVYGQSGDRPEGVGELITSERGSLAFHHSGRGPETVGPVTEAWWRLASPIQVKNPHSGERIGDTIFSDISTEEYNKRMIDQALDESVREQRKLIPNPRWGIHANAGIFEMWRGWDTDAYDVITSYSTIFSFIVGMYVLFLLAARWRGRVRAGHCRTCGYCMNGNISGVCPECGAAYTPREKKPASGQGRAICDAAQRQVTSEPAKSKKVSGTF